MADVILTFKLMGESPEVDMASLKETATKICSEFDAEVGKTEEQPIAFGIKALLLYVVRAESKGSADELEKRLGELEGVKSAQVIDVRRTMG